jgi:Ca2+-transporting ATPase
MADEPAPVHARSVEQVLRDLDVRADAGLSAEEVRRRRERHGANRLPRAKGPRLWQIALDQFKSIVVAILAAAAVLAFSLGQAPEGIAIVAVLAVNGLIGFVGQWRAVRSIQALREKGKPRARVRRGGRERQNRTSALVPGDVVVLDAGDAVPADLRLIEANNFHADESSLTGESTPAAKTTDPGDTDAPLAERASLLYRGTTVTEGSGEGVVVATGGHTEIGRITELAEETESGPSPLQERLNRFGARIGWLALALAGLVAVVGYLSGRELRLMIETAVALGVAAVPEGVPIATTIALARGMWLLARRKALTRRLTAVETLGATTVIFADKTGTLTENRMTLRRVATPAGRFDLETREPENPGDVEPALRRVLEVGVLCNNATVDGPENASGPAQEQDGQGDPMEVALLTAGRRFGLGRQEMLDRSPEAREVAFDADVMMMATVHEADRGYRVAVKGAPQAVLEACDSIASSEGDGAESLDEDLRREWAERARSMAEEGLRLLAMAEKGASDPDADPYESLTFLGLAGLMDPPRKGVGEAIADCRGAGIRPVMVTGDRGETAVAVAEQVGLEVEGAEAVMEGPEIGEGEALDAETRRRALQASVFARLSPEQKYHLLRIHQDAGETVAMTGDGVNDAPALRKADIGVAMGRRGTDAARQAADIVLKDDAFATIVTAVRQGRTIFANIRKALTFMLCTNLAEILAVAGASLAGAPLPLRPLQILYLNVLTDVFPALALGVGKGSPGLMDRPPRPRNESVLTRRHWLAIGAWSAILAICVLGALAWAKRGAGMDTPRAVTVSFLTLGFAKLWFVFNLRDGGSRLLANDVVGNPWIWAALAVCTALLVAAVYVPGLSLVLKTEGPGAGGWAAVLLLSLVPAAAGQVLRGVQRRWSRAASAGA